MSLCVAKRDFINVIKLRIFRWEIILDYVGRPNIITRVLIRGRQECESRKEIKVEEEFVVICLKWRKGPLQVGKGEKRILRNLQKEFSLRNILILDF